MMGYKLVKESHLKSLQDMIDTKDDRLCSAGFAITDLQYKLAMSLKYVNKLSDDISRLQLKLEQRDAEAANIIAGLMNERENDLEFITADHIKYINELQEENDNLRKIVIDVCKNKGA
jgi:hypothetical protein